MSFVVCVQSLHPQLVVTETYTGNISDRETTDRALGTDMRNHNMTTQIAALPTSLIIRDITVTSCINCVASTEQPCLQCSKDSHCQVTYSLLNAIN